MPVARDTAAATASTGNPATRSPVQGASAAKGTTIPMPTATSSPR